MSAPDQSTPPNSPPRRSRFLNLRLAAILVVMAGGIAFLCLWNLGDGRTESQTISFSHIHDGRDITFIAIELAEDSAIPWAKPVEVVYDEQFPNFNGELQLANLAYIALGDGGIFSFPLTPEIDRETFRESTSIAGGKHMVRRDVFQSSSYYPNGVKSGKHQREGCRNLHSRGSGESRSYEAVQEGDSSFAFAPPRQGAPSACCRLWNRWKAVAQLASLDSALHGGSKLHLQAV